MFKNQFYRFKNQFSFETPHTGEILELRAKKQKTCLKYSNVSPKILRAI